MYELVHNDRVIGGVDENSPDKAVEFYSLFVKGENYIGQMPAQLRCISLQRMQAVMFILLL